MSQQVLHRAAGSLGSPFAMDSAIIADQLWDSLSGGDGSSSQVNPLGEGEDQIEDEEEASHLLKSVDKKNKPQTMYAPACAFNVYSQARKIALANQAARRAVQATETRIPHDKKVCVIIGVTMLHSLARCAHHQPPPPHIFILHN